MARTSESDAEPASGRSARTLELLEERSGTVTIGELAEAVSRAEGVAEDPGAVHEDLYRKVLPSLEERGELRFDVERGIVFPEPEENGTLLGRLGEWLSW